MPLLRPFDASPLTLRLNRDLVRMLKRGHPWVYADALRDRPSAPPGTPALLLDNRKGREVARGFYDPTSPLAFRACSVDDRKLDENWAERRCDRALALRRLLFDEQTTGYRLVNGEGDGLPGLVVDVYGATAVLKFDGNGPRGFWNARGLAEWFAERLSLECVYERLRERGTGGETLLGTPPHAPVAFLEHGLRFSADVVHGQKTGFFLDQRDNRRLVRQLADGRKTLNVFGYTGGFSVAAGTGGATHVTTVDSAAPAIEAAEQHWRLNGLPDDRHEAVVADAFAFLEAAAQDRRHWDLVVIDPPSFAPSKSAIDRACAAYQRLAMSGAAVTAGNGLLALASCSSHVDLPTFLNLCEEGVSHARRRATVVAITGQPADHPTPLVLPEFRYLKFVLLRIE